MSGLLKKSPGNALRGGLANCWSMLSKHRLAARLRAFLSRVLALAEDDHAGNLDEELQAHADLLAADYVRSGMTEGEARQAAWRELGNITSVREQYSEQKGLPLVENFWLDLKYGFRTLRRNPAFTASCVATLTLGLGCMITVLCVVQAFFWKPLPYPNPNRLVVLKEVDPRGGLWTFSSPALLDVEQRSTSLSAISAYDRRTMALTGVGEPEVLQAAAITPSFFQMFGIKPMAGAVFHNTLPQVVISRRLFDRRWQMDSQVVGQAILLDGASYTVAGVADAPRDMLPGVDLLIPLEPRATESRTQHEIEVVARLHDGVVPGQAQAELSTVAAGIARQHGQNSAGWSMRVLPLAGFLVGPGLAHRVWMIFAAVALLWILACANVAGLQMARSVARRHEISTRMALGAGRGRILAQTLTESIVLASAGAILGTVLAEFAMEAIRRFAADSLPRLADLHLDGSAFATAVACVFGSTILSGLFSARIPDFQGGREMARRDRGRDALIVLQVALASVLLLVASLLSQSFLRLRAVNPGFDPDKVLIVRASLPASVQRATFIRHASEMLTRLPDVESAGATNVVPFSGEGTANRFRIGQESSLSDFHVASWRAVTPSFFSTLGVPLRRGRLFTDADANGALEVVIISESMARQFWPNQNPVGKTLLWGGSASPKVIVGVVGDLRDLAVDAHPVPTMFRPFAQLSDAPMTFVVRTNAEPTAAIADIRRGIWSLDRNVALEFKPLRDAMSDSLMRPRATLAAIAAFALMAILTAAFGLYGLISYRVNQRQQEIGIRLALGAPAASVRWSVQRRCLALVCAGSAIGLPLAFLLAGLIGSLLYETQPAQASAYLLVALVFVAVAFAASFGPARRASRMDPVAAIRYE